jgi:hypothetical protein
MLDLKPFYEEEVIKLGGDTITLAIDFRAVDFIETLLDASLPSVVAMLFADPPPLSLAGKVLRGLLLRHHEDVSLDQCAGLMFGEHGNRVALAMYRLITRALRLEPEKKKKPRRKRAASE